MAAAEVSARDTILALAVEMIDADGEAALRMADIAERAGVAVALISHHFGSREGLVSEAQLFRFRRQPFLDAARIEAAVMAIDDVDSFRGLLHELTRDVVGLQRSVLRMERVTEIAATHGRPELRGKLMDANREVTDSIQHAVALAQRVGFVRRDLDARALALFVQAYAMGFVLADLDPNRPDDEALATVIDAVTAGLYAS